MKKKLLIAAYSLDFGGIEKSLVNLLNSLDQNKFAITLVLEEKKGVFLDKINKNINVLEYKPSKNKIVNMFKRLKWLVSNHNKYDISVCYATYSLPSNFIARSSSKKRIIYIHSNYYELFNKSVEKFKEFYDQRFLDEFNKIIFVSNEAKKDLLNIYPQLQDKGEVINNLVNVKEIRDKAKEDSKITLKNKYLGVFVGRLDEDSKKVSRIIELAKKCQDSGDDIGFVIVGDGPDKDKYLSSSAKLKNIEFVGLQTNPYSYINKANFLLLTSRYEGFPVVYNEAIILNKPILTTIDVSDDEIVLPNRFGIITKSEDLYDNLKKIIKFKPEVIDFEKINSLRIKKITKLIEDLYEEN